MCCRPARCCRCLRRNHRPEGRGSAGGYLGRQRSRRRTASGGRLCTVRLGQRDPPLGRFRPRPGHRPAGVARHHPRHPRHPGWRRDLLGGGSRLGPHRPRWQRRRASLAADGRPPPGTRTASGGIEGWRDCGIRHRQRPVTVRSRYRPAECRRRRRMAHGGGANRRAGYRQLEARRAADERRAPGT